MRSLDNIKFASIVLLTLCTAKHPEPTHPVTDPGLMSVDRVLMRKAPGAAEAPAPPERSLHSARRS